jgi:hypothetical protein
VRPYRSRSHPEAKSSLRLQYSTSHLIKLDGLEERFEIIFAKALIAFTLNDFKEGRADLILGEYLKQKAALGGAVEQNAIFLKPRHILAMIG